LSTGEESKGGEWVWFGVVGVVGVVSEGDGVVDQRGMGVEVR
jgi:hypothetical protein